MAKNKETTTINIGGVDVEAYVTTLADGMVQVARTVNGPWYVRQKNDDGAFVGGYTDWQSGEVSIPTETLQKLGIPSYGVLYKAEGKTRAGGYAGYFLCPGKRAKRIGLATLTVAGALIFLGHMAGVPATNADIDAEYAAEKDRIVSYEPGLTDKIQQEIEHPENMTFVQNGTVFGLSGAESLSSEQGETAEQSQESIEDLIKKAESKGLDPTKIPGYESYVALRADIVKLMYGEPETSEDGSPVYDEDGYLVYKTTVTVKDPRAGHENEDITLTPFRILEEEASSYPYQLISSNRAHKNKAAELADILQVLEEQRDEAAATLRSNLNSEIGQIDGSNTGSESERLQSAKDQAQGYANDARTSANSAARSASDISGKVSSDKFMNEEEKASAQTAAENAQKLAELADKAAVAAQGAADSAQEQSKSAQAELYRDKAQDYKELAERLANGGTITEDEKAALEELKQSIEDQDLKAFADTVVGADGTVKGIVDYGNQVDTEITAAAENRLNENNEFVLNLTDTQIATLKNAAQKQAVVNFFDAQGDGFKSYTYENGNFAFIFDGTVGRKEDANVVISFELGELNANTDLMKAYTDAAKASAVKVSVYRDIENVSISSAAKRASIIAAVAAAERNRQSTFGQAENAEALGQIRYSFRTVETDGQGTYVSASQLVIDENGNYHVQDLPNTLASDKDAAIETAVAGSVKGFGVNYRQIQQATSKNEDPEA